MKASARRNFRNEIKKAIHDVQAVWPNCGIKADLEGVTVTKTSPSVKKKPPRLQLDQYSSVSECPLWALSLCPGQSAHIYPHSKSYTQGLTCWFIYFPWSLITIICRTISSRGKPSSQR